MDKVSKETMVGGASLTKLLGTAAWYATGASVSYLVDSILNYHRKFKIILNYRQKFRIVLNYRQKYVFFVNNTHFSSQVYTMKPTCGKLIVFPAWTKHSVEINNSDTERISIAFNFVDPQFKPM